MLLLVSSQKWRVLEVVGRGSKRGKRRRHNIGKTDNAKAGKALVREGEGAPHILEDGEGGVCSRSEGERRIGSLFLHS